MVERVYTIGGYGFSGNEFFEQLVAAKIDAFCDIRQRRGMRGRTYAFLNSNQLQARLKQLGITYLHLKEFAPSNFIRNKQKEADKQCGCTKRQRSILGPVFTELYIAENLYSKNPGDFFSKLPKECVRPCLFCVEKLPEACHRSLMASWLAADSGLDIVHIMPT